MRNEPLHGIRLFSHGRGNPDTEANRSLNAGTPHSHARRGRPVRPKEEQPKIRRESDPLIVLGDGRADHRGKGRTEVRRGQRKQEYYISRPSEYMPPSHELVVNRVQMASPGTISLKGLGEPLKQLRELIKDLWYRNRQERKLGDLEIIERQLSLLTHRALAPSTVQAVSVLMVEDTADLQELVGSGMLRLPNEELTHSEGSKSKVRRGSRGKRPRRSSG